MRSILLVFTLACFMAASAQAGALAPCSAGAVGENVIPVQDSSVTYCVSDFGWSDTYLLGTPAIYNPVVDMLSGDDALSLNFNAPPTGVGSGTGWLSPSLDMGTLKAQSVPSNWSLVTAVHSTGPNSAESVIRDADGLQIRIDTSVVGFGAQLTLYITNTSLNTITGLQLADYFNFHPDGSQESDNLDGTTSYQNGCIVTTGVSGAAFLMNGYMCGMSAPSNYEVGSAAGPSAVWLAVQNEAYLNNSGPVGPGDTAGALEWNLGSLAPGATVEFGIGKNLDPVLPPVPEPASVFLAAAALLGLSVRARRLRRGRSA